MDELDQEPKDKIRSDQTVSSTESLKANCAHSVSSNDIENLSLDHDETLSLTGCVLQSSGSSGQDPLLEAKYIPGYEEFYKQANRRSKSSGVQTMEKGEGPAADQDEGGSAEEKLVPSGTVVGADADTVIAITDKLLAMHNALDDGYGSISSSPHSTGIPSNRSKTPHKTIPTTFLWPVKKDLQVELDARSDTVECRVVSPDSTGAAPDDRETWDRRTDFLLSIIGFAIDLANVWRFPYLCYKNGGGAFLIPYTLMMVFGAVPLFYMELILGQYNRQGPISVWRICPIFKGVGFCAVIIAFFVSFYYNVIIAWSLYYLMASTSSTLPWIHCNNTWNTDRCLGSANITADNNTLLGINVSASDFVKFTPASEYFHRAVLEIQSSEGIHDLGAPRWQLVVCLLVVYCTLYFSLFKGIKSSGLVVWVTATMPYVVLTILLIHGLMLPGALTGISFYLKPELSRLQDAQVWVDAAVQIFYSVGAGFGVHLSYASYNEFHNNCLRDCLVTTAVNCFTSFFSGFVIFTYLGFMSHKFNIPIKTVANEGPSLVFEVYPEAVASLPGSNISAMLFFFMLIMLGLDSAMGGLECVITGLMDEFHSVFKGNKYSREIFTMCAVIVSFSIALINVTPGGMYTFQLLDTHAAGISLLCSALFEAIAVSWFYGLDRFGDDVEAMIGVRPNLYWRVCWKFISPLFLIGVVISAFFNHSPLQYGEYKYPRWTEIMGWMLTLSSVIMIPLVAIINIYKTEGTCSERLGINISPIEEHEEIRRTHKVARFKSSHWLHI